MFIIIRDNKTTILDTTTIRDNDTVSIASKIKLVSLEVLIANIEDHDFAVRMSNGADIAVITRENNDLMLATDKFDPMAITDKNNSLLVADKNVFGVENVLGFNKTLEIYYIPTALEVYNIPRDTLEVTIPTTLEVYNIPTMYLLWRYTYNIPRNTLEVSSIPTTDNTSGVYHIPVNMLEVCNILNTRDNFADNFGTCAGSFDRFTSDPVLATGGCIRISGDFQQCNFGNYNPFSLESTIT